MAKHGESSGSVGMCWLSATQDYGQEGFHCIPISTSQCRAHQCKNKIQSLTTIYVHTLELRRVEYFTDLGF